MRSVKYLVAAGAASLLSSMAFAADMPIIRRRRHIMRRHRSRISADGICAAISASAIRRVERSRSTACYDAATPRRISSLASTPQESSASASVIGSTTGSAPTSPVSTAAIRSSHGHSTVITGIGRLAVGTDTYHATKSELVVLANAYVDLGTWWCMTPFVGAGVGARAGLDRQFHRSRRSPTTAAARCRASPTATTCAKWNFAWALHAGVAYKINPRLHRRTRLSLSQHGQRHDRRSQDSSTAPTTSTTR